MIIGIVLICILGISFVSANWFTDLFNIGEESRLRGQLASIQDGGYIIESDFGSIIYEVGSLEQGLTADVVDYVSTIFNNPINGEFARYQITDTSYDSDMFISIVEFQDEISFEEFDSNLVSIFEREGMNLDYDPVEWIDTNGYSLENAQFLSVGNYYTDTMSPGEIIWISNNKIILIGFDDWRAINEGPDESIEILVEAYLAAYPSTLVLPEVPPSTVEPFCGDGICGGVDEFYTMNDGVEININYLGRNYVLGADISGTDQVIITVDGESMKIDEGGIQEFSSGLIVIIEDVNVGPGGEYIGNIEFAIGEDERTCPQDCGDIAVDRCSELSDETIETINYLIDRSETHGYGYVSLREGDMIQENEYFITSNDYPGYGQLWEVKNIDMIDLEVKIEDQVEGASTITVHLSEDYGDYYLGTFVLKNGASAEMKLYGNDNSDVYVTVTDPLPGTSTYYNCAVSPPVYACCEKTTWGGSCQYDLESNCDTNFLTSQDCWNIPSCQPGCCITDWEGGGCQEYASPGYCDGTWNEDYTCEIPQCELGCCVIGEGIDAIYGTSSYCDDIRNNLVAEFKPISELECINTYGGAIDTYVAKGWNMIYGFVDPTTQIVDGNIGEENIKAIYALMPDNQEYARVYPEPEIDKLNRLDDDYLLNTGFWVYSNKESEMSYRLFEDIIPFNQRQMYHGWNFVGITPDMIDEEGREEIRHLLGDCALESSYIFDAEDQRWFELPIHEEFYDREIIGMTWVIKVSGDCHLGRYEETIVAPPALPWSGGSGGINSQYPQAIGSYELESSYQEQEECGVWEELSEEICIKGAEVRYLNEMEGKGVSLYLITVSKGFDAYQQFLESQSEVAMRVNDREIYRVDGQTLFWYADTYDLIMNSEFDVRYDYYDDGYSRSYYYGQATGANPVTQWFMGEYPPITVVPIPVA